MSGLWSHCSDETAPAKVRCVNGTYYVTYSKVHRRAGAAALWTDRVVRLFYLLGYLSAKK